MRSLPIAVCLCVGLVGFAVTAAAVSPDTSSKAGEGSTQSPSQVVAPQTADQPNSSAGSPAGNPKTGSTNTVTTLRTDQPGRNAKECWGYAKLCAEITARMAGNTKNSDEVFTNLRNERRLVQEAIDQEHRNLNQINTDITELQRTLEYTDGESEKKEIRFDLDNKKDAQKQSEEAIAWLTSQLSEVDAKVVSVLRVENNNAMFKKDTALNFEMLIGGVIAGFFLITWFTGTARDIFNNQSGLQFITLFSLVISIVLFGILNILEGRELAALLGAISGYVLGRVSAGEVKTALAVPKYGETTESNASPPGASSNPPKPGAAPASPPHPVTA